MDLLHSKLDLLFTHRKPVILSALLLLTLSVTLVLVKQQQDSRTHAAYFTSCNTASPAQFSTSASSQAVDQLKNTTGSVKQILHSSLSTQTSDTERWRTQVAQRKTALIATMRSNPTAALNSVLDSKDQIQGELLSDNCVEQHANLEGTLSTYVVDNFQAQSQTFYTLTADGHEYSVHFAHEDRKTLKPGVKVRMSGYKVDNEFLVNEADTSSIQTLTPGASDQFSAIPTSQGDQSVAAILITMQSSPTSPLPASSIDTGVMNNINNYYKENSYGKVNLHWKTFGWYTVSNFTSCADMNAVGNIVNTAINTAASNGMNPADYTRFVIFLNDASNLGCPFDGIGSIGLVPFSGGGISGNKSWALALQKSSSGTNTVAWQSMIAGHEMGHNFGDGHASSWDCGGVALATSGCQKAGVTGEYGDSFDIMGNDFAEMDAYHKEYIGWLTSAQVPTVTQSGTYTIEPMETNTGGIKAIKIPRGNNDFLYVEYKQKIGVDANLGHGKPTDVYSGALIHVLLPELHSGLIDTSPPLDQPLTYTPALKVGQSLTDPVTGVTVKTTNATSTGLTVAVTYPGSNQTGVTGTPTPTPPTNVTATPTPVSGTNPTPTSTGGNTNSPVLQLSAKLFGIGSGIGNNASPVVRDTNGYVQVYDTNNQKVYDATTDMLYRASTGDYAGTVNTPLAPGKYYIKLRFKNTLWKRLASISDLKAGDNTLSAGTLTLGDFNSDNSLDMSDYSQFVTCYGTKTCANKPLMDLNFDNIVDGIDYNILRASFANRQGD